MGDHFKADKQDPREGRYIPCTIKGGPVFEDAINNKVYLIQADVERSIPLTAERLALNELELQLYQPRPLAVVPGRSDDDEILEKPALLEPPMPRRDGLKRRSKPFDQAFFCQFPPRSRAPRDLRFLYTSEEEMGPVAYWSESETSSYDGRMWLDASEDEEWEEEEEQKEERENNMDQQESAPPLVTDERGGSVDIGETRDKPAQPADDTRKW